MILLRGFFRKKTAKIYLIIFSTLLTTIIILFSLINYYSNLENDFFQKTSYLLVISKKDCYEKLTKNKSIVNIERVLLFEPDYTYDTLKKINEDESSEDNSQVNWQDIFETGNQMILVFPSSKNKLDLNDRQVLFELSSITTEYKNVKGLSKRQIGFYHENNKIEFEIKNIYESYFTNILISDNIFHNLLNKSKTFAYVLTIENYEKAISIEHELQTLDDIEKANLNQKFYDNRELKTMNTVKDLIKSLKIASYIIIIAFSIIFTVVIRNIIKDEYKNINVERLLGYNEKQIKKHLCLKTTVLDIMACSIATAITMIIIVMINKFLGFKLSILDPFLLLRVYGLLLLITSLLCLFSKTNQKISD